MVRPATGTSTGAAVRVRDIPPVGSTWFARLRRAVPTGGRRSRASRTTAPVGSTRFAPLCRAAFPGLRATLCGRRLAERAKNSGTEPPVRCPHDRGESVKGGHPPLSQSVTSNRNSPKGAPAHEGVSIPARSAGRFGRGGSILSRLTTRTSPAMCPPPEPLSRRRRRAARTEPRRAWSRPGIPDRPAAAGSASRLRRGRS